MAREDAKLVRSQHSGPRVHEKEIFHEVEVIEIFLVGAWLVETGEVPVGIRDGFHLYV
jgi:hypothetical protein